MDEADRREMTVFVTRDCFNDACAADVRPRRCRGFRSRLGDRLKWANISLAEGKVIRSGELTADMCDLVAVPKAVVRKGSDWICLDQG